MLSLVVILALVLAACGPAPAPTPLPTLTKPPALAAAAPTPMPPTATKPPAPAAATSTPMPPAPATTTPQPSQVPDMPGSIGEVRAEGPTTIDGHPAMRLTDGRTVLLQTAENQRVPSWFIPRQPEPPEPVERRRICSRPPFAVNVNLQANQTPVRDQGGRWTCTVFAITAALEAAYRRQYGLTLDLSEQYLNHVQKSHC